MPFRSVFRGYGAHLPERQMHNDELAKLVDTSDEWIIARTGIRTRYIAGDHETTSTLAINAAKKALDNARMSPSDIDLIVLATATPDQTFPATATRVQAALGCGQGAAFDIQAVCSGFIFALGVVDNFLVRGQFRNALVIGAETFSRILDWQDRTTCVLFGDGAGAMVFSSEPTTAGDQAKDQPGIRQVHMRSDGTKHDLLYVDGGPSTTRSVGHLRMQGSQVFKHAVTNLSDSILHVVHEQGLTIGDIDWFVPHQANQRILEAVARRIGIDESRVISTVSQHGNTSAASVPLAFAQAMDDGRIQKGQLVLMEAMGGGFSWGSALLRL